MNIPKKEELRKFTDKCLSKQMIEPEVADYVKSRLETEEFRITVVGEFSSGKSTFINALIGKDILPHSSSETTATITYIHNVDKGDKREGVAYIKKVDGSEEQKSFAELKEYVTSFSKNIKVFEEIDHVDIYTHIPNFDKNIVLIDTPGLNGTNNYENKTMHEISQAAASIFLFSTGGIKSSELSFYRNDLSQYQNSFFFVMNKIDDLKQSEGESYEKKEPEFKTQISKEFYGGETMPKYVFGVSALYALVSKDLSIKRLHADSPNELTDEDRKICWEKSKYEILTSNLSEYLKKEKESVFFESMADFLCARLREKVADLKSDIEVNAPKEDLPALAVINAEREKCKFRFDTYRKNLYNNVKAKLDDVQENRIKGQYIGMINMYKTSRLDVVKKQMDKINSIEEFEKAYNKDGSKIQVEIDSFYSTQYEKFSKLLDGDLNAVEYVLEEEIRKMTPSISSLKRSGNNARVAMDSSSFTFKGDTTKIDSLNREISDLQRQIGEKESQQRGYDASRQSYNSQISSYNSQLSSVRLSINRMGARPRKRTWTTTEYKTVAVERSILNPFRWFGDKYDYEERPYTKQHEDDSAGIEYDNRKRTLERESSQLQAKIDNLQVSLRNVPNLSIQIDRLKRELDDKKDVIQKQIEREEQQRQYQRTQFLNGRKSSLMAAVTRAFDEVVSALKKDMTKMLDDNANGIVSGITKYLEQSKTQYLARLNNMEHNLTASTQEVARKRNVLELQKSEVESMINEVNNLKK